MTQTQDDRLAQPVASSVENLDAPTVAAYLRANSDFFVTHADLLTELLLPHESGDAVSLVERQVSVLRGRNIETRKDLVKLREAAKTNDAHFAKTRDLVLTMLDAPDLITLVSSLNAGIRSEFSAVSAVGIFALDGSLKPVLGIHSTTRAEAEEKLGNLLKGGAACGAVREQEAQFLFPDGPSIKSAAVVALRHAMFRGVLALGSTNAEHFSPGMDTLFLRFIGEVLSRLLVVRGR